jgi:putative Mn2+ efflux pump MntP
MIVEEFKESDEHDDEKHVCDVNLSYGKIIILAVATSIDALATGVVFVPCPDRLFLGVGSIGLVSFIMSLIGTQIGFNIGKRLSFKWGVLGGVILILIGTKILIEHTCFS